MRMAAPLPFTFAYEYTWLWLGARRPFMRRRHAVGERNGRERNSTRGDSWRHRTAQRTAGSRRGEATRHGAARRWATREARRLRARVSSLLVSSRLPHVSRTRARARVLGSHVRVCRRGAARPLVPRSSPLLTPRPRPTSPSSYRCPFASLCTALVLLGARARRHTLTCTTHEHCWDAAAAAHGHHQRHTHTLVARAVPCLTRSRHIRIIRNQICRARDVTVRVTVNQSEWSGAEHVSALLGCAASARCKLVLVAVSVHLP